MGGEIDWAAVDVIAELLGVGDVELLIYHLVAIRDHMTKD